MTVRPAIEPRSSSWRAAGSAVGQDRGNHARVAVSPGDFFIPFYPFWALTAITVDILVTWALAAHGKALAEG